MPNPVDFQPANLLIMLTPAQWRRVYVTLLAHWETLGEIIKHLVGIFLKEDAEQSQALIDRYKNERGQLYVALQQIKKECRNNGIPLEEGEDDDRGKQGAIPAGGLPGPAPSAEAGNAEVQDHAPTGAVDGQGGGQEGGERG